MASHLTPENPALRVGLYRMYRDFFFRAERKRRWNIELDIPWDQANRAMDPAIADVVESFCAVEMYLPDYVAKALPMIRTNRGWAWFHVNWGYEESKHSLALGDWLLHSGARTEEQMADLEGMVFNREWELPMDSGAGMLVYAMAQELATFLHYRNLREHVDRVGDPALSKLLRLIAVDEKSHYAFYSDVVSLFLEMNREETLEQLRRVLNGFSMPAIHLLADGRQREADIRELAIFNESIFYEEVYQPILAKLGVTRREMRQRRPRESVVAASPLPSR